MKYYTSRSHIIRWAKWADELELLNDSLLVLVGSNWPNKKSRVGVGSDAGSEAGSKAKDTESKEDRAAVSYRA